jgi:hypothetical protein
MIIDALFHGIKCGRDVKLLRASSAEAKREWSYASNHPLCLHIVIGTTLPPQTATLQTAVSVHQPLPQEIFTVSLIICGENKIVLTE